MKKMMKVMAILALVLGLAGLVMAQSKAGDRAKKAAGANAAAPATGADKKTPAEPDKSAATTAAKAEDNKSKDPLENLKFRNLGPAVGGGRVTAVVGIPGKPNM